MKQNLNLELYGLKTFYSPQLVDKGALINASNVNVEEVGRIETRRGFKDYVAALGSQVNVLFNFQNKLLCQYSDKIAWLDETATPTWTNIVGSGYAVPNPLVRMKYEYQSNNVYYTSDNGIYKIDTYNVAPSLAGAPVGLGGSLALSGAGSGWFSPDEQVAYRVVWGYRDANNNLILGAPSERMVIVNPLAGTADTVDLEIQVPNGITTDYFFQVYRSGFSGGEDVEPNDNLGLIYEEDYVSGDTVAFTDITPDSLRGATLYTSTEGIAQANYQPPMAVDIASFKNVMLYANTKTKHRLFIDLLAVDNGGGNGIAINDVITINGRTYTGKAAENIPLREFEVANSSSAADNIDITARSLVRVVNGDSGNTVIAGYYLSGYNDLPGKMMFERTNLDDTSFSFDINNNKNAFNPNLTNGALVSDNEEAPNRIYFSKVQQPEAVPLLSYTDVSSKNFEILRIIPLRDSVFIFKTDGIYRLSGETAPFNIFKFDNTVIIKAPESAVVFDNQIYLFSNQGVVAVNDSGVVIQSRDIENLLRPLLNADLFPDLGLDTVAISYDSDRKYILSTYRNEGDTEPTISYVYNSLSRQWTSWAKPFTASIVRTNDDKLYLCDLDNKTLIERKNLNQFDYADREIDVTIVSYDLSENIVVLTDTTDVVAGWTLRQNNSYAKIEEVLPTYTAVPYTSYSDGTLASTPPGATQFVLSQAITTNTDPGGSIQSEWFDPSNAYSTSTPGVSWGLSGAGTGGGVYFIILDINYLANLSNQTIVVDLGNGGSFQFAFDYQAVLRAYNLGFDYIHVDQNGALYGAEDQFGIFDYANLILTPDFLTGAAGSATPTSYAYGSVLLSQTGSFTAGAATVNEPILSEIEFVPQHAGNTGRQKHWQEIIYIFNDLRASTFTAGFKSDYSNVLQNVTFNISDTEAWGLFAWGETPWGGDVGGATRQRTFFPIPVQRAFRANLSMSMEESFSKFNLNGLSIIYDDMEARQR